MNKNVPAGAAMLLDFIAGFESRGRYDVIYGNHETQLQTPITQLPIGSLLVKQDMWGRMWGSSAAGRYQIMPNTLRGLMAGLGLTGSELFDPDLQDRLGYALLTRRGYNQFITGALTLQAFALQLAQEWASLPVLATTAGQHMTVKRGQSFYESDGLNHALVAPERVEAILAQVATFGPVKPVQKPTVTLPGKPRLPTGPVAAGGAVVAGGAVALSNGASWPAVIFAVVVVAAIGTGAWLFFRGKVK